MSSALTTRRRAERFDALVAHPSAGSDDPRLAELLELVGQLRSVPAPQPGADFSAALRGRLMTEADAVLLPRDRRTDERLTLPTRRVHTRSPRDRRLAVAAGALAMVGAASSMAVAAQSALPGDTLYPVKRALEDAHAGVSLGDASRGATLLDNAAGRLDEAAALALAGDEASLASAPGALSDFVDQAEQGSTLLLEDYSRTLDASSIERVRDFTGSSLDALGSLEASLPESADEELQRAAAALAEIDARASDLCATCGGLGIADVPPSLLANAGLTPSGDVAPSTRPFVIGGQELGRVDESPGGPAGPDGTGGADEDGRQGRGQDGGGRGSVDDPDLPQVDGELPPGSVLGGDGSGLVEQLTGGLLGGVNGDLGAPARGDRGDRGDNGGLPGPAKPLTDPVEEVGDTLGDILGGVTGPGPQGSGSNGTGSNGTGSNGTGSNDSGSDGSGSGLLGGLLD